jgi:ABC-type sulfate transport system permease component
MFLVEGYFKKNYLYFGYGLSLLISILLIVFLLGVISLGSRMEYAYSKNYLDNHRMLNGRGYGYLLAFFAAEFLFLLFVTKGFVDSYFFHRYTFEQLMNHRGSLFL